MKRMCRAVLAMVAWTCLTGVTVPWQVPPVPLEPLRDTLRHKGHAWVSATCGSSQAPWAYRGRFGRQTMLRPFVTVKTDARWVRPFVDTLLHEEDWDSVSAVHAPFASSVPCDRPAPHTQFTVRFAGDPDVYVLLLLDARQAFVFQAQQPLGAVRFDARADAILALLREALPGDSTLAAGPPPLRPPAASGHADSASVDVLPEVTERALPVYPTAARQRDVEGEVDLQALIGPDGAVEDVFVVNSIPGLDDAALDAVWRWRFRPAMQNGQPLRVWVMVPVRFRLR